MLHLFALSHNRGRHGPLATRCFPLGRLSVEGGCWWTPHHTHVNIYALGRRRRRVFESGGGGNCRIFNPVTEWPLQSAVYFTLRGFSEGAWQGDAVVEWWWMLVAYLVGWFGCCSCYTDLQLYLSRGGGIGKSHQGGDMLSLPLVDHGLVVGGTLWQDNVGCCYYGSWWWGGGVFPSNTVKVGGASVEELELERPDRRDQSFRGAHGGWVKAALLLQNTRSLHVINHTSLYLVL